MKIVTILFISIFLSACGGGSSSGSSPSPEPVVDDSSTDEQSEQESEFFSVEGYAIKGVIQGGLVSAYPISELGVIGDEAVATAVTDDTGSYSLNIPADYDSYAFKLSVTALDDTRMVCDSKSATGCVDSGGLAVPFGQTFALTDDFVLSAVVPSVSADLPVTTNISILTTIATDIVLAMLEQSTGEAPQAIIEQANAEVAESYGLTQELTEISAVDLTDDSQLNNADIDAVRSSLISAGIMTEVFELEPGNIGQGLENFANSHRLDDGALVNDSTITIIQSLQTSLDLLSQILLDSPSINNAAVFELSTELEATIDSAVDEGAPDNLTEEEQDPEQEEEQEENPLSLFEGRYDISWDLKQGSEPIVAYILVGDQGLARLYLDDVAVGASQYVSASGDLVIEDFLFNVDLYVSLAGTENGQVVPGSYGNGSSVSGDLTVQKYSDTLNFLNLAGAYPIEWSFPDSWIFVISDEGLIEVKDEQSLSPYSSAQIADDGSFTLSSLYGSSTYFEGVLTRKAVITGSYNSSFIAEPLEASKFFLEGTYGVYDASSDYGIYDSSADFYRGDASMDASSDASTDASTDASADGSPGALGPYSISSFVVDASNRLTFVLSYALDTIYSVVVATDLEPGGEFNVLAATEQGTTLAVEGKIDAFGVSGAYSVVDGSPESAALDGNKLASDEALEVIIERNGFLEGETDHQIYLAFKHPVLLGSTDTHDIDQNGVNLGDAGNGVNNSDDRPILGSNNFNLAGDNNTTITDDECASFFRYVDDGDGADFVSGCQVIFATGTNESSLAVAQGMLIRFSTTLPASIDDQLSIEGEFVSSFNYAVAEGFTAQAIRPLDFSGLAGVYIYPWFKQQDDNYYLKEYFVLDDEGNFEFRFLHAFFSDFFVRSTVVSADGSFIFEETGGSDFPFYYPLIKGSIDQTGDITATPSDMIPYTYEGFYWVIDASSDFAVDASFDASYDASNDSVLSGVSFTRFLVDASDQLTVAMRYVLDSVYTLTFDAQIAEDGSFEALSYDVNGNEVLLSGQFSIEGVNANYHWFSPTPIDRDIVGKFLSLGAPLDIETTDNSFVENEVEHELSLRFSHPIYIGTTADEDINGDGSITGEVGPATSSSDDRPVLGANNLSGTGNNDATLSAAECAEFFTLVSDVGTTITDCQVHFIVDGGNESDIAFGGATQALRLVFSTNNPADLSDHLEVAGEFISLHHHQTSEWDADPIPALNFWLLQGIYSFDDSTYDGYLEVLGNGTIALYSDFTGLTGYFPIGADGDFEIIVPGFPSLSGTLSSDGTISDVPFFGSGIAMRSDSLNIYTAVDASADASSDSASLFPTITRFLLDTSGQLTAVIGYMLDEVYSLSLSSAIASDGSFEFSGVDVNGDAISVQGGFELTGGLSAELQWDTAEPYHSLITGESLHDPELTVSITDNGFASGSTNHVVAMTFSHPVLIGTTAVYDIDADGLISGDLGPSSSGLDDRPVLGSNNLSGLGDNNNSITAEECAEFFTVINESNPGQSLLSCNVEFVTGVNSTVGITAQQITLSFETAEPASPGDQLLPAGEFVSAPSGAVFQGLLASPLVSLSGFIEYPWNPDLGSGINESYRFNVTAAGPLQATMTAQAFEAEFAIYRYDDTLGEYIEIVRSDSSDGVAQVDAYLEVGDYYLVVGTANYNNSGGNFTLELTGASANSLFSQHHVPPGVYGIIDINSDLNGGGGSSTPYGLTFTNVEIGSDRTIRFVLSYLDSGLQQIAFASDLNDDGGFSVEGVDHLGGPVSISASYAGYDFVGSFSWPGLAGDGNFDGHIRTYSSVSALVEKVAFGVDESSHQIRLYSGSTHPFFVASTAYFDSNNDGFTDGEMGPGVNSADDRPVLGSNNFSGLGDNSRTISTEECAEFFTLQDDGDGAAFVDGCSVVFESGSNTVNGFSSRNMTVIFDTTRPLTAGDRLAVNGEIVSVFNGSIETIDDILVDAPVQALETLLGEWVNSGGRSPLHPNNPRYSLVVTDAANIFLALSSSVDTYLYVLDSGLNVIAEDDDAGAGLNSEISIDLAAGNYYVVAATFSEDEMGVFELSFAGLNAVISPEI